MLEPDHLLSQDTCGSGEKPRQKIRLIAPKSSSGSDAYGQGQCGCGTGFLPALDETLSAANVEGIRAALNSGQGLGNEKFRDQIKALLR